VQIKSDGGPQVRDVILAMLTLSAFAALGTQPAAAVGTRYPFCLQGNDQPGLSNCTFVSYEQCQATASGRRLYCVPNPFYAGNGHDPRADRRPNRLPPSPPPFFGLFDD
jgi:hypothetical protein